MFIYFIVYIIIIIINVGLHIHVYTFVFVYTRYIHFRRLATTDMATRIHTFMVPYIVFIDINNITIRLDCPEFAVPKSLYILFHFQVSVTFRSRGLSPLHTVFKVIAVPT